MEKNTIYPKCIKTEDDLRFVLRNYGLTRKDITVISHAFSLVKSKDSAIQIFANLAGKNSLLSDNARMLASVIAKGRYIDHAINVWLTVVHKRYKNEKQDKYTNKSVYSNNEVDNHNNYHFWKLQTNQNFRAWSESILQRAQLGAKKFWTILYKTLPQNLYFLVVIHIKCDISFIFLTTKIKQYVNTC